MKRKNEAQWQPLNGDQGAAATPQRRINARSPLIVPSSPQINFNVAESYSFMDLKP